MRRGFPVHGFAGAAIVAAAELLLLRGNRFALAYFTPLVWTGYILLVDAIVAVRTGRSPLTARRLEFFLSLPLSIVCWYVFEGVNLLLGNWEYVNLPESAAARWLGYAWAYATIFPGIFVTAELLQGIIGGRLSGRRPLRYGARVEGIFFVAGLLLFVAVLVFPSPWLAPLPWISVLLWLEGLNGRLSLGSFGRQFERGEYGFFVSLLISGAVCGLLWEFWNYWAGTKWIYHVPYLPRLRLFEMPVLGFLGFIPFAAECWLMYRLARFLTPVPVGIDVVGRPWERSNIVKEVGP